MKPYHPANFTLTPYAGWRLIVLAWVGKLLDIQFHVNGIPFGGPYRPERDGFGEIDCASEGNGG